ncbi:MAG: hypothetical protein DHS20C01_36520 [marine bacterium B5-7]|nr:MAG: hypothetical protein DHS20C01_36520 [marine bacterium B5-7]
MKVMSTHIHLKFSHLLCGLVVLLTSATGATGAFAGQDRPAKARKPIPPYEDIYTENAKNSPFAYDIHAWVYPATSAKRFQMPARWIDDDLTGTLALAYRVEWMSGRTCGYGDAPHCRKRVRCVMDAYFDQVDAAANLLPFRNDLEVNLDSFGGEQSLHWLSPQSPVDQQQIAELRHSVTLASAVVINYQDKGGHVRNDETNTFQYERRRYNLDAISFQIDCNLPGKLKDIDGPLRIVMGNAGVSAEDLKQQLMQTASGEGDSVTAGERINRVITIPKGFYPRWTALHDKYIAWEPAYHDTIVDAPWHMDMQRDTPAEYNRRFTDKASGLYDEDIHIWTYTQEFADRFGMPAKWVSKEDLGDAVALGFRVERDVSGICGGGFNLKNCRRFETCIWDIYVPDDKPLPWYVDWPVSSVSGGHDHSIRFLQINDWDLTDKSIEVSRLSEFVYGGGDESSRVTAPIGFQLIEQHRKSLLGFGYWSDEQWWGSAGITARAHERRVQGLQMISLTRGCTVPALWEDDKKETKLRMRDYRLLFMSRTDRYERLFNRLQENRIGKPEAAVEVRIPKVYKIRWTDHQVSVSQSLKQMERFSKTGSLQ